MKTKIVRRSVLKGILDEIRSQGKKIVFTNGCFDILHIGHLRYLEEARNLGDCLVIALNTDDSVRRLKGPERPFVNEFERAEMLAGLQCVDYVTFFSEATATEIIRELRPHIYAKGGDCVADQVPEADAVKSCDGQIAILSKVQGKSTSKLVSQVRSVPDTVETAAGSRGKVIGMIPARLAATRLPNKPLIDIAGKPMIQWVYERASQAELIDEVIVATPDEEIRQCVESFGGKVSMTSHEHRSGTDRLEEAARRLEADIIVNIQGDEPLLDPSAIDMLVRAMLDDSSVPMGSMMCPLKDDHEASDPAVVKVVTDNQGYALYFSRSVIPYPRDPQAAQARKHIGIYAYRWYFLLSFAALDPTPLEKAESLEQLRALENGYQIKMVETCFSPTSVDTPEDLERVRAILAKQG